MLKWTGCSLLHQNWKHLFFLFKWQRKIRHLILEIFSSDYNAQNLPSISFRTKMKTIVSSCVAKSMINLLKLLMHTNQQNNNVIYPAVKRAWGSVLFFKRTVWCLSVGHFGGPLFPLLLTWKRYQQWNFHNPVPLSTSPSCYWEVWRSPVWPWTCCSYSSIPFVCAAGGTKMRSSPTLTAAAQPGVSSLQHLFAGEYKHRTRVAFTRCVADVSYFAFTHPYANIQEEAGHQSTTGQS